MLSAVAPSRNEKVAVDALLRERCAAMVLLGSTLDADGLAVLAEGVPLIVVARRTEACGVGVVRGDDLAGITLAVDHLVGMGHRRIAHIDGADAPGSEDRRKGFLAAMRNHGLRNSAVVLAGGLTENAGARAATELLGQKRPPTAIVAFNDRQATGVLDVLVRRGLRVPEDVSVIGYDDSRLAKIPHVQMTTISQDAQEMARVALLDALALIAGQPAQERVLTPTLVERSTTGPVSIIG